MLRSVLLLVFYLGAGDASTMECYTQSGAAYNGTRNITTTGEPCLPWSEFKHLRLRNSWNTSVLQEHSNFCRNPDNDPRGPWCMVTRSRYGTCGIPHCEHLIDCYEGVGENYLGDVSVTEKGRVCLPWYDVFSMTFGSNANEFSRFAIVNYTAANNYTILSNAEAASTGFRSCRNPGGRMAKPWCYVHVNTPFMTFSSSGVKQGLCNVSLCDQSIHMGLPLDFGDECPAGFTTQVGKTLSSQGEISTVYCVLTGKGLQTTEKFKNFCMFLLNQNQETCPRDFTMKRTFMRTKLQSKSKFSLFRQEGVTSIWISLCCTNGSHLERSSNFPKTSIVPKQFLNRNPPGSNILMRKVISSTPTQPIGFEYPSHTSPETGSKRRPIFVSIERCPPVKGTRRKVFTMGTYQPSNLTATLLDHGYYTSLCTYYEDDGEEEASGIGSFEQPRQTLVPSILVEGSLCPPHFSPAPTAKVHHLFQYLRAAFTLCKPDGTYRADDMDKLLPTGNICFISHTQEEIKGHTVASSSSATEQSNAEDYEEERFEDGVLKSTRQVCPKGFEMSELRWAGGNASAHGYETVNMMFCCRNGSAEESQKKSLDPISTPTYDLPHYLLSVPTFAVLILGGSCPDYRDKDNKLSADFRPTMQTESYMTLELIGQSNPVDFIESMTGVRGVLAICKYSQPRDEIGVMAPQGFCRGVGERRVPTVHTPLDGGVTCAVNVTDIYFPPGSYCFYKTAKVCPPGLPELQDSVFEGYVRSLLLQTMLVPSPGLANAKELCCLSEESLGAIEMPLNITTQFALPALQAACQSFIGYTVDLSKGFCEYTPITEQPESIVVWPRRVFPNNLRGKTEIVLTCSERWNLHSVSKARNLMTRHRRLWLVPTPMQDFSSNDAMELCYSEVRGIEVPTRTENGFLNYCVIAFATCPNEDFEVVSAFPYYQYVVCCVKQPPEAQYTPTTFQTVSTWPEHVVSIVTLGRKGPADEEKVKDLSGPTELHRDLKQPESHQGCPAFEQYSVIRRFVKMWRPRRYKTLFMRPSIPGLLNFTTSMSVEAYANRTGIWLQDGLLHAIFCEYHTNRPAESASDISWPVGNYAILKPVTGCPPTFESTDFIHFQGRNGFHYSQPIHLAGDYIATSRAVKLHYCHREVDSAPTQWNKKHVNSLPPGHYCILMVGRRCPAGFTSGSLSVYEGILDGNASLNRDAGSEASGLPKSASSSSSSSSSSSTPSSSSSSTRNVPCIFRDKVEKKDTGLTFDRVTYMFCCRADSPSASIPISGFPNNTGPFYLYRAGETCQEIAGLRASEEYICMDAPEFLVGSSPSFAFPMEIMDKTFHIEGFTPTISTSTDDCNVKINLCYYEPSIQEFESEPPNEVSSGQAWPGGSYSLLTTIREDGSLACPPGFSLAIRYNIKPDVIANTFFRPMSFAEYFTQKTATSDDIFADTATPMPTLHTCERNSSDLPETYNLTAFPSWPPGNYCVLMDLHTRRCPQGLDRFTRQLAELCCHSGKSAPPTPVKLPFIGDFFLMGAFDEPDLTCLPIEHTHVEKYVVLLFSSLDPHIHSLCHYLPLQWLHTSRTWPHGDYLLPIGNRGQQLSAITDTLPDFTGSPTPTPPPPTPPPDQLTKFSCPTGFHRLIHEYEVYSRELENASTTEPEETPTSRVMLHFCQRVVNSEDPAPSNTSWPRGDYCVIVKGAICPIEMRASNKLVMRIPRSYLHAIHNATDYGLIREGESMVLPVGSRDVTYYSVCCREDKRLLVDLPAFSGGMYLPAGSSLCSSIPGTFIEHEQVATYLDPTLLGPYTAGNGVSQMFPEMKAQRWMPPPFEEPGIMTLCYYHQMQNISKDGKTEEGNLLHELLEPGTTALSLWLAGECGCAQNAFCRPFKRFSCKCKKGYFGDGVRICRLVTPITDPCANLCHKDGECTIRQKHSFISRTKEETTCVCKHGFVGDGFSCLPRCSAHFCQPFSRCEIRNGEPTCVCVSGTIDDNGKCHFDIYSSFQEEKDLPQYMLQHLSCFDDDVLKALVTQRPKRYFILFAPPRLLKTCNEIRSHIATLSSEKEYETFVTSPEYQLISLNGSIINVTNKGDITANGDKVEYKPVVFTNGRIYYTASELKYIPASATSYGLGITLTVVLILAVPILLIGGFFAIKYWKPKLTAFKRHRPFQPMVSGQQASWRGSTGVLIAPDEIEE